jgi:3'(2'), 5'-bisphosphate nucleotidase
MPAGPEAAFSFLRLAEAAALEAGAAILAIHARGLAAAETKADGSPVTEADLAASDIILRHLREGTPGIPVLCEEADPLAIAPLLEGGRFWLVDPLDGTREFLSRNGEFTVNIALVEQGVAVAGVVLAPAQGVMWSGALGGPGATRVDTATGARRPIHARRSSPDGLVALASRSHLDPATEAYLAGLPITSRLQIGSAQKFGLLAEGRADIYPRFSPTMEWDTAAGQAVLEAAGGSVTTPGGKPFRYGRREAGFRNGAFIARGAN